MNLDFHHALTKRILPSRSAAAGPCGGVVDWARGGWRFRARPGFSRECDHPPGATRLTCWNPGFTTQGSWSAARPVGP